MREAARQPPSSVTAVPRVGAALETIN